MRLIFGQPVDKISVESPIVFCAIKSHECPVEGRGILGVMLDFDCIYMKFSMKVDFDELNDFPKFGYNQLSLSLIHI